MFKHKTAYEMRISDWSSDVCSSELPRSPAGRSVLPRIRADQRGSRANTYGKLYPCSPALIRGRKGRAGSAADRGLAYNRRMKEKEQIVENWLPRYTGVPLDQFGEHILLTNFGGYLDHFARLAGAQIVGADRPMPSATADGLTMINFGMGSPNAATMMDLLSAIAPKAVLFLGKCGGLKKKNRLGDLVLPIAAIRGEGTSNDYLPPEVPALPAFALQCAVSTMIRDLGLDYWTGTVFRSEEHTSELQ